MDEKLKKDIEAVVAEIFSQKEDAEKKVRTEEALSKAAATISELTETLEGKNAQEEEVAAKFEALETQIKDLTSKLEAAQKEVETSNTKLAESEKTIMEMNKDKATELRMKEISDAGIALENKEAQAGKVREMTDEEFATYKDELLSLRKAVEAELAKAAEEQATKEKEEEEKKAAAAAKEAEEKANAETKEEVVPPPPQVNKEDAAKAALNLEVKKDDILSKYAEMGKALAQRMTAGRK
jgi:hypothetical protein